MPNKLSAIAKLKVLIVDDDRSYADILRRVTEKLDCEALCISDGKEIGQVLIGFNPDVIFLDLVLPGFNGVDIILSLAKSKCRAKIILMSGLDRRTISSVSEVASTNNLNVLDAVTKPITGNQIRALLLPLIKAKKTVISDSRKTNPGPLIGPQLLYEPQYCMEVNENTNPYCFRTELVWALDSGQVVPITKLIEKSMKTDIGAGLVLFTLDLAGRDITRFKVTPNRVRLKVSLPDALLINMSAAKILENAVTVNNIYKENIVFEIDAQSILKNLDSAHVVMSQLKIKGIKLSIVVRSEIEHILSILNKLPIDEIVIDMLSKGLQDRAISNSETEFQIGSLVSVAKKAGIDTAVMNLVTQKQKDFVEKCQFSYASGPLIAVKTDITGALRIHKS